jgi:hypothetical protein
MGEKKTQEKRYIINNAKFEITRDELLALNERLDVLTREILRGLNDTLRGQNDTLRGQIDKLRGQIDELRGQNYAQNSEIINLRGQNKALNSEIVELRREKQEMSLHFYKKIEQQEINQDGMNVNYFTDNDKTA